MKKIFFFLGLFIGTVSHTVGQIMYKSQYRNALVYDITGASPLTNSISFERSFSRTLKSFYAAKAGIGLVPGSTSLSTSGIAFPVSITERILISNLKKDIKKRMNRCKPEPAKYNFEWFGDFGVGYTPIIYMNSPPGNNRQNVYGIISFCQYLSVDIPPKPKVFYVKGYYTPGYNITKQHFYFLPIDLKGQLEANNVLGLAVGMGL